MEQVINSTKSFIKFQISHCPLIWMFCSRISMNKLNNIHENCLSLVTNDYDSNFNELLESSNELSIHKPASTTLQGISPELMTDIFTLRKNPYNIIFVYYNLTTYLQYSQYSENPRSVLEWIK